jgi:TonB family protein
MTSASRFLRALPVSGKGLALLGSVSVHVAVALAAARGAPHDASDASRATAAVIDIAELELTATEASVQPLAASATLHGAAMARHHHDYPVPPNHEAERHDAAIEHVLPVRGAAPAILPAAPPSILAPSTPATPHFQMTIGPAPRALSGTSPAGGLPPVPGQGARIEPAPEASVDTPARLRTGSAPTYTPEAEAAGVEADVPLEIVVDGTGAVISARALSQVGYGLDEAALKSVRGYRFSPARRAGQALAVRMRWLMRFQLR